MTDRLKSIELRYAQIEARLAANETYADPELVSRLNKEQKELEPLATAYRSVVKAQQALQDARALLFDPELKELAQEEERQAREEVERLERDIQILVLQAKGKGYALDEGCRAPLTAWYARKQAEDAATNGNGRMARNALERPS